MTIRLGTDTAWAVFSDCMRYRYVLAREWPMPEEPTPARRTFITWVMLNPSTADHEVLDPTLRRCEAFSRRWGYAGFYVVNAYAYRSTDPKVLPRIDGRPSWRAIGPDNDRLIDLWCAGRDVVVGWGKHIDLNRASELSSRLTNICLRVDCLGTNKDGSPQHPLYIPGATPRQPW